ncbi:GDP-mannose transporter GONST1 [Micractinium conductrix]|uniref:GDP-mannose transporter GONST1 n=1 Tax=Micractinium conductrix TaxID=554055 RepID=A0A2P6VGU4_9CHLO|nr:GDP-mannose transporter GONST1 [Micractinium conductrix]|eukprot:PSC73311.1 GDP-mannose transporter GONST1 [Micractinium conductrix]
MKQSDSNSSVHTIVYSLDSERRQKALPFGLPSGAVAGAAYCTASLSMVLLNKVALSSFDFKSANALLFFQCALCVTLVHTCRMLGLVKVEPFNVQIVRVWAPVNLIFVGMIGTSFWALRSLNVGMVTVLKNLTNLFVLSGDYFLYGRTYKLNVWGCVGLMMLSAVCGAATDLAFNAIGYFWQIVNCMFTAAYSLYMRGAMDRVAQHTSDGKKLGEFSMVFYNNLLSLPFIGLIMAFTGEVRDVWQEPDLHNPTFLAVAALSGFIGFAISFTSLWFLSSTTPSIYSLVGSLNKIPLAVIGLLAFNAPWTLPNLLSILVGTAAGVVFVAVKNRGG